MPPSQSWPTPTYVSALDNLLPYPAHLHPGRQVLFIGLKLVALQVVVPDNQRTRHRSKAAQVLSCHAQAFLRACTGQQGHVSWAEPVECGVMYRRVAGASEHILRQGHGHALEMGLRDCYVKTLAGPTVG